MRTIRLSARLERIAGMVTVGHRLADVGCDHAWLPLFLVQSGRIPSAIALDINAGPLIRAEEHIREYGLADRIETRQSDGLRGLSGSEADTVVIAGMGGDLMLKILSARPELAERLPELILSPQSEVERVREYLNSRGYRFLDEALVCEDGKWYFIMKVSAAAGYREAGLAADDEDSMAFGPVLLAGRDPRLREWLCWRRELLEGILKQLDRAGTEGRAEERKHGILQELVRIDRAAGRFYIEKGEERI